jgi:hypothetical protein
MYIMVFVQNEIDNTYCDGGVHVNDIDSLVVNLKHFFSVIFRLQDHLYDTQKYVKIKYFVRDFSVQSLLHVYTKVYTTSTNMYHKVNISMSLDLYK